jgi:MoxR-like ATPase
MRHRIGLSYEALSESVSPDDIITQILRAVPAPEQPLQSHVRVAAAG